MVDTEVLGYVIPKGTQIFMVRTYDFFFVVVVIVAEFHTIKKVRWEKRGVFNYYSFLLTKTYFFFHQKIGSTRSRFHRNTHSRTRNLSFSI